MTLCEVSTLANQDLYMLDVRLDADTNTPTNKQTLKQTNKTYVSSTRRMRHISSGSDLRLYILGVRLGTVQTCSGVRSWCGRLRRIYWIKQWVTILISYNTLSILKGYCGRNVLTFTEKIKKDHVHMGNTWGIGEYFSLLLIENTSFWCLWWCQDWFGLPVALSRAACIGIWKLLTWPSVGHDVLWVHMQTRDDPLLFSKESVSLTCSQGYCLINTEPPALRDFRTTE